MPTSFQLESQTPAPLSPSEQSEHSIMDVNAQSSNPVVFMPLTERACFKLHGRSCECPTTKNGELKVHEGAPHGMCTTIKDQINQDILAFVRKPVPASV
jgi:hypothetical protein